MPAEKRPYRGPEDAIRIGLPSAPLNDLYYRLMGGPWWRLITLFIAFYVVANLGFATLYLFDTRGISQAHDGDFVDAFFFSVQTISTIGYGSMSPQTGYANLLVTAEAMVGLLGFALATGLIFAKFSRAKARVLFSRSLICTQRNGKPHLMLRVANERGNEVVEASIRVAVLKEETSQEGEKLRRVIDLKLARSTSPLFALSWLAMHEIDEESPLHGVTPQSAADGGLLFIVTLTGIDGTFAETVHARCIYTHEDLAWGRRFVDVIDFVDERVRIDYTKFHDTTPDPAWTGPTA